MSSIRQGTEAEISASILLRVGGRKDCVAWKNMTGTARSLTPPHQVIQYGKKGSPDILGVIAPGLFFGIEVKTLKGQQRDNQKLFQDAIERRGGIYIIGRDPDQAERDLLNARAEFAALWGMENRINYDSMEIMDYE